MIISLIKSCLPSLRLDYLNLRIYPKPYVLSKATTKLNTKRKIFFDIINLKPF
jgi:hypothetical protein